MDIDLQKVIHFLLGRVALLEGKLLVQDRLIKQLMSSVYNVSGEQLDASLPSDALKYQEMIASYLQWLALHDVRMDRSLADMLSSLGIAHPE